MHPHMAVARGAKGAFHLGAGALRVVAFGGKMGEKDVGEVRAGDLGGHPGAMAVGEMALAAKDPLLERPGPP